MPTILVADDNSNIQKMVTLAFQEKGIRVVAVGNGEAACRKVPEVQPDLVLADVFMPVRNGYEVCEFVKQDPQFAGTPVILLVGAFDPLDEKEAQRVGANGVLKKPFVPPEPLIAMVSSLLPKTGTEEEQAKPAAEITPTLPKIEPPPSPAASSQAPSEFAFGSASSEVEESDIATPTFSEPVATPLAKAPEAEEDLEPASEWSRRRAAVDYEIDAADSANMVEKLAAEGTVDEREIVAANKYVPFGGANVPEASSEASTERRAIQWTNLAEQETPSEELVEKAEAPVPAIEEPAATIESAEPSIPYIQSQTEPHSSHSEEIVMPSANAETTPVVMAKTTPVMESAGAASFDDKTPENVPAPWDAPPFFQEPALETIDSQATVSADHAIWQKPHEPAEKISAMPASVSETASNWIREKVETVATESAALKIEATSSEAEAHQATVDEMVAKVISKLEPQLHEALSKGVLRPLVEEILNQREKK